MSVVLPTAITSMLDSRDDGGYTDYGSTIDSSQFAASMCPPVSSKPHVTEPLHMQPTDFAKISAGQISKSYGSLDSPGSQLESSVVPAASTGRVRRMSLPSAPIVDPAVIFGPSVYTAGRSLQSSSVTVPFLAGGRHPANLREQNMSGYEADGPNEHGPVSRSGALDNNQETSHFSRASFGSMESFVTISKTSGYPTVDECNRFDSRGSINLVDAPPCHSSAPVNILSSWTAPSISGYQFTFSNKGRSNSCGLDTAVLDNEVSASEGLRVQENR